MTLLKKGRETEKQRIFSLATLRLRASALAFFSGLTDCHGFLFLSVLIRIIRFIRG
jgi:hypothetical protein